MDYDSLSIDKKLVYDWIRLEIEDGKRSHDEIREDFISIYGDKELEFFEAIVSELVD